MVFIGGPNAPQIPDNSIICVDTQYVQCFFEIVLINLSEVHVNLIFRILLVLKDTMNLNFVPLLCART